MPPLIRRYITLETVDKKKRFTMKEEEVLCSEETVCSCNQSD